MGFLAGKKILIAGLLSNRSIAYGIAAAMKREGAELAFTYQLEKHEKRVADLAADFDSNIVLPCDVAEDAQIESLFPALAKHWDGLDGLVHSLAFVPKMALDGDYLDTIGLDGISRENFRIAHDISSYSFQPWRKRPTR
jgi:enoyl-[acyl-carrier protein] reductase I